MEDKGGSRSGLQTAADLARGAKAVYNISRAAAAAGIKGAAVAAAKEALPFLLKLVICIVIAVLAIPMVIFTALPNIFFGYMSSDTAMVEQMTEQAMTIGGAYMSLEEFERSHIDSMVTSIAAEYEQDGTVIDRIEVKNDFEEEDLIWLIAINSVAYQQDLDAMSVETVRSFCTSRLKYSPSIGLFSDGEGFVTTTLTVKVERPDPDELMDDLGFDDEAKTWASALYETLFESDALTRYGSYFDSYRPNYEGDTSYTDSIEYGTGDEIIIDISDFTDPETKNNLDLAAYAIQAWENNWGYVWGTYGNILTKSLLDYKLEQYPDGVGKYKDYIEKNYLGRRTADCVGLIKGYGWLDTTDMTIGYAENGMPDYGADQMYRSAVDDGTAGIDYGTMETMPETVGLAVWKEGHIGVYIGNGYVIEAMSTKKGVVKTQLDERGWTGWCRLPYIDYIEEG